MSAEAIRALVQYLVTQRLKKKGKHVYLTEGSGNMPNWPYQASRNNQGCFWWLSKCLDKSQAPVGKHQKKKHVVEYGMQMAGMWAGPVAGAMVDAVLGSYGMADGAGSAVQGTLELMIDKAEGHHFKGDRDERNLQRDNRNFAKGKKCWYDIAFQQDFVCGGVAAVTPREGGAIVCIKVFDVKNDYLYFLGLAENKGIDYARTLAFNSNTAFFITKGNQIVPLDTSALTKLGWKGAA